MLCWWHDIWIHIICPQHIPSGIPSNIMWCPNSIPMFILNYIKCSSCKPTFRCRKPTICRSLSCWWEISCMTNWMLETCWNLINNGMFVTRNSKTMDKLTTHRLLDFATIHLSGSPWSPEAAPREPAPRVPSPWPGVAHRPLDSVHAPGPCRHWQWKNDGRKGRWWTKRIF